MLIRSFVSFSERACLIQIAKGRFCSFISKRNIYHIHSAKTRIESAEEQYPQNTKGVKMHSVARNNNYTFLWKKSDQRNCLIKLLGAIPVWLGKFHFIGNIIWLHAVETSPKTWYETSGKTSDEFHLNQLTGDSTLYKRLHSKYTSEFNERDLAGSISAIIKGRQVGKQGCRVWDQQCIDRPRTAREPTEASRRTKTLQTIFR